MPAHFPENLYRAVGPSAKDDTSALRIYCEVPVSIDEEGSSFIVLSASFGLATNESWTYRYPSIEADGRIFRFHPPVNVDVRHDGEYWAACNDDFEIESVSRSEEGAIDGLGIEFAMLWAHIVSEVDANLTTDARELKQRLLKRITVEVKK